MKEESIVNMIEKDAEDFLIPAYFASMPTIEDEKRDFEELKSIYIAGRSKYIESEKAKDERIKELEEGINILRELAHIKIYKDKNGKDEYYEKNQPELWKKAIAYLNSYVNK